MGNDDDIYSTYSDDPDLLEVIEDFVRSLPTQVDAVEEALRKRDLVALGTLAHRLRGAGGTVGFDAITGAAECVELLARGGEGDLEQAVSNLARVCRSARPGLPPT